MKITDESIKNSVLLEIQWDVFKSFLYKKRKEEDCPHDICNGATYIIKKGTALVTMTLLDEKFKLIGGITKTLFKALREYAEEKSHVRFELVPKVGYICHFYEDANPLQEQAENLIIQEQEIMSKKNQAKTNEWAEKNKALNAYNAFAKSKNCESVEEYFKQSEQTSELLKQREIEVADLKSQLQKKEEEVSELNNLLFQYKVQLQTKVESTPVPQVTQPQPQPIITSVVQEEQEVPDPEPLAIFKKYVDELYANQHTKSVILNCSGKIQSVKFKTECKDEYNKYLEVRGDVINSLDYKMMDLADAYVNKKYNQNIN